MKCNTCDLLLQQDSFHAVYESEFWKIHLADNQAYLGRAYIDSKIHIENISDLSEAQWIDLHTAIAWYEARLRKLWGVTLFNWTCLMNNAYKENPPSPHMHWHVWPRYEREVEIAGLRFADPNFAHHYDKDSKRVLDELTLEYIASSIRE